MKISPQPNIIQLKIESVKIAGLDTSSYNSAIEYAEVLAVGEGVKDIKVGDKVFVKSWAIDIITHNDKKYYFVNLDSKGLLAIIKE